MRIAALLGLLVLAPEARADPSGVGLGVAAGIAVPHASPVRFTPSYAFGFYVDIPLISTFSITPSTVVYGVDPKGDVKQNPNTDTSLSFKFVIPIGIVDIFFGITAGLTTSQDFDFHVGGLAGFGIQIISNLEVFAQANYRVLIDDGHERNDLHVFAGPLFRFR
jgi:hypothetical protein